MNPVNATALYVSASRSALRCDPRDPRALAELCRLLPFFRQSLSCLVCGKGLCLFVVHHYYYYYCISSLVVVVVVVVRAAAAAAAASLEVRTAMMTHPLLCDFIAVVVQTIR